MQTNAIQLFNISPEQFKSDILQGIEELISKHIKENNSQDKLLTRQEVAELLSISLPTLRSYVKRGLIKENRIGSRVLYKKSDVIEFTNSKK